MFVETSTNMQRENFRCHQTPRKWANEKGSFSIQRKKPEKGEKIRTKGDFLRPFHFLVRFPSLSNS